MADHREKSALTHVQVRLKGRFPGLAPEVVEAAVRIAAADQAYGALGLGVDKLEHAASARLSAIAPEAAG